MRNLLDAYAKAASSWALTVSDRALLRSVKALDDMRAGTYSPTRFTQDIYAYWRDVADFRPAATVGFLPTASLDIGGWAGARASNFVQVPAIPLADLGLTPVVNAQTKTALAGLELDSNGGDNSVRVHWVKANAGAEPTGLDRNGLFQGGIFRKDNGELVASVYVRTRLP